jgi:hypothetical protein
MMQIHRWSPRSTGGKTHDSREGEMAIGKVPTLLLFFFLGAMAACSGNNNEPEDRIRQGQTGSGSSARGQDLEPKLTLAGREVEIVGIVQEVQHGFAIWTLTETFIVQDRDLSDMVGSNVKATGFIGEHNGRPIIQIKEIKELR